MFLYNHYNLSMIFPIYHALPIRNLMDKQGFCVRLQHHKRRFAKVQSDLHSVPHVTVSLQFPLVKTSLISEIKT